MVKHRRRYAKPTSSLQDRVAIFAKDVRERAALLPDGHERNDLLKKADAADAASLRLNAWDGGAGKS